jgi:transketolase
LKYTTDEGGVIGIERVGESAPGEQVFEEFGFTVDNVVAKAKALL